MITTSTKCYACRSSIDVPPVREEHQHVVCSCGFTTIFAGRRPVREAGARMAHEADVRRGYRLPMFNLELLGRYPDETNAAFRRRIRIRQGLDPEE